MKNLKLSIVIPVFNEKNNISKIYTDIKSNLKSISDYEIIFIDDGSTDSSDNEIELLSVNDKSVKFLILQRNYGQTLAIKAGIDFSLGENILICDGDCQNDPADFDKIIQVFFDERLDFVTAKRIFREDNRNRILYSKIANFIISRIFTKKITDLGCAMKIIRKDILKDVSFYGDAHRYLSLILANTGYSYKEVSVNHNKRMHGVSKYGFERFFKVISDIFYLYFYFNFFSKPMHLFGLLGIGCFAGSLLSFVLMIIYKFKGISFISTPLPLIVITLLILGMLSFLLGIIAEITVRNFFHNKDIKSYLIKKYKKSV
jgi:glycosyltransferase involved in cell wall biosynthesis